jgi:hypothetical protein
MSIGTLAERSLHAAVKRWYSRPGDKVEEKVDGYVVDILRGEQCIEIQTGNFSGFRSKLATLLGHHPVHVVFPLAIERRVVRTTADGIALSSRRSPKRGQVIDVFDELVHIPQLIMDPNFTLEVLFTKEEIVLKDDGKGSWRRKGWSLADRRLVSVEGSLVLSSLSDFRRLLPSSLPEKFTVTELAREVPCSGSMAGRMAYTLRLMGVLRSAGRRGRASVYEVATDPYEVDGER